MKGHPPDLILLKDNIKPIYQTLQIKAFYATEHRNKK